jgi:ABC-type multidrug transport system fused ATPase/permease subunit
VVAAVIIAVITVVAALVGALYGDLMRGGEPFSLIEGVSVWPSEVLRLIAGMLASYLLVRGYSRHMLALQKIESRFKGLGADSSEAAATPTHESVANAAEKVWASYRRGCEGMAVVKRVSLEAAALFSLALAMMVAWGIPNHPTRGPIAWSVDVVLIFVVLVPFLALLFYMVDATRQARDLAKRLEKGVIWPYPTLKSRHLANWVKGAKDAEFSRDPVVLDVELVGAATTPVGNLVWHPILVLIVIAVSRLPLFDAWNLPVPLLVVMGLALTYAVTSAWRLRRAAETVRTNATRKFTEDLRRLRDQPDTESQIKRVEEMLQEVKATDEGAFRPFSRQPVVQAILTLISSLTGIAVLQYSSLVNL